MATGYSRVADLTSYFNNIYEDCVFAVREGTLATRVCTVFTDGAGDQTRTLPEYSSVSYSAVAETEDFATPTRFSKSALATLTPGEVMAQIILTDRRIETDPDNARADASAELGLAAADKVDSDILSNGTSFTGGSVGASGSTMIWGYLWAAISRLRAGKVPRPYYAILHPYHWHALAKAAATGATVTNAPSFQDDVMMKWFVGAAGGVDILYSVNLPTSGTDAFSLVFNPRALAFDLRRDYRLEPERDASKRAWELNATMLYAHGVWRPLWGCYIKATASAPSS